MSLMNKEWLYMHILSVSYWYLLNYKWKHVKLFVQCIILLLLIINGLLSNRWILKNLLFFAKNRSINIFIDSPNRGERVKILPLELWQTSSTKIGYVGDYFAKTGCKTEDRFIDIFRVVSCYFGCVGVVFCSAIASWYLISFAAKREKWLKIFS